MQDAVIIILCIAPLLINVITGGSDAQSRAKYGSVGLGLAFCFFASGRIAIPEELVMMLPEWVPYRLAIIYLTGILEICIAAALFIPCWRRIGGMAAATVLVLFFPANIYAAVNYKGEIESALGPSYLWMRTPLQMFLVAWTYWPINRKHRSESECRN